MFCPRVPLRIRLQKERIQSLKTRLFLVRNSQTNWKVQSHLYFFWKSEQRCHVFDTYFKCSTYFRWLAHPFSSCTLLYSQASEGARIAQGGSPGRYFMRRKMLKNVENIFTRIVKVQLKIMRSHQIPIRKYSSQRFREDFTSWPLFCRRPAAVDWPWNLEMLATTQEILLYHYVWCIYSLGRTSDLKGPSIKLISNGYFIYDWYMIYVDGAKLLRFWALSLAPCINAQLPWVCNMLGKRPRPRNLWNLRKISYGTVGYFRMVLKHTNELDWVRLCLLYPSWNSPFCLFIQVTQVVFFT